MQHLTVENGLSSSTVYKIFHDSHGYIWFATEAGLDRYNGTEFTNYGYSDGIPDLRIYNIYEDLEGRVWFISKTGKPCYFQNNRFHTHPFNGLLDKYAISAIVETHDKRLIVGTYDNYVLEIKDGKIKWKDSLKIIHNDGILDLLEVHNTIIGTDARGLIFIKGHKLYEHTLKIGRSYSRIRLGKINQQCYFSCSEGLARLQDTQQVYLNIYQGEEVFDLLQDNAGKLLLGTKNGLTIIPDVNLPGTPLHYLSLKMVSTITQDHDGNIWMGTLNDGAYIILNGGFRNFDQSSGLKSDQVLCIAGNKQHYIWAGDDQGNVYTIHNDRINMYSFKFVKTHNRITDIATDSDNNVAIASDHYAIVFNRGSLKVAYPTSSVKRIELRGDTILTAYVGTGLDKSSFKSLEHIGRKPHIINDIHSINTFAMDGDNFYVLSKENVYFSNGKQVKPFLPHYLSGKIVSRITPSKDAIWFASKGNGVIRVSKQDSSVQSFTTTDGLASNFCSNIFIHNNKAWVSTNRGISIIDCSYSHPSIRNIDFKDGLPSNEVNAIYIDQHNNLWAATNKGIAFLPDAEATPHIAPPLINIEAVSANNHPLLWINAPITLPYDSNKLFIKVAGMSFRNKNVARYAYLIQGLDTAWSYSTQNTFILPALPPGSYTILCKAISPSGEASLKPASLHITILKPYWQKAWFIILAIFSSLTLLFGIGFIIFSIIRFNEKRKAEVSRRIAESEIKALRSQMNPHFLFNAMNSIQHFILQNDKKAANEYLAKFAKLMRMMLDNSRKQSINLHDEIFFLNSYLELEALRFEHKLSYGILCSDALDTENISLPSMIIQPVVENAIKHGIAHKKEGGRIEIEFFPKEDKLCCIIRDNGIGRKRARAIALANADHHTGTGLSATMERINLLSADKERKADMKINDIILKDGSPGGTEIEIIIPLEDIETD